MAEVPAPPRRPDFLRWGLAVLSVAVAAALTTGPGGERLFPEPPERFVHAKSGDQRFGARQTTYP